MHGKTGEQPILSGEDSFNLSYDLPNHWSRSLPMRADMGSWLHRHTCEEIVYLQYGIRLFFFFSF